MSLILECPHCQDCYTIAEWNKSPHRGDTIPEDLETDAAFQNWDIDSDGGLYDCPSCGRVVVTGDMTVV
jgi:endogenous inhibitor of DNA gyrase (YacG/DUF329 family)